LLGLNFKLSPKERLSLASLLSSSLGMTLVSVVGGVLGYAYQLIVGRMMEPAEYAVLISITSLGTVFSSPLGAISMLVSRSISSFFGGNKLRDISDYYQKITTQLACVGILLIIFCMPFMEIIGNFLKCESITPIILFLLITYFGSFGTVNNAYFQGIRYFRWLAVTSIFSVIIKLAISPFLILIGMGINGALIGMMFAALIPGLLGLFKIHSINKNNYYKNLVIHRDAYKVINFRDRLSIMTILLANVAFAIMTQLDVVLVNRFFPSLDAGLYSAAATIGRTILYLPGGVSIVIFPYVASLHSRGEMNYSNFYRLFFITFLICFMAALFLFLFSELLVRNIYGSSYSGAEYILKWYGFAILPMSMVMLAENFLIAKNEVIFTWLFIFIAPIEIICMYNFHQSLDKILLVIFISGLLLLLLGFLFIYFKMQTTSREI